MNKNEIYDVAAIMTLLEIEAGNEDGSTYEDRHRRKTMSKHIDASNCEIGFFGVLTIVFVALKLLKIVTWPWAFVLIPIWLPIVIFLVLVLLGFLVLYIAEKRYKE